MWTHNSSQEEWPKHLCLLHLKSQSYSTAWNTDALTNCMVSVQLILTSQTRSLVPPSHRLILILCCTDCKPEALRWKVSLSVWLLYFQLAQFTPTADGRKATSYKRLDSKLQTFPVTGSWCGQDPQNKEYPKLRKVIASSVKIKAPKNLHIKSKLTRLNCLC